MLMTNTARNSHVKPKRMIDMQQFYTYLHCKPNGDPFYVGKGCVSRSNRSNNFSQRSRYHKNIVAKYGAENIGVFVFPCDSEEQALSDEIHQIAQLRAEGFCLVNLTEGGDGISGYRHTDDHKTALSNRFKGRRFGPGYVRTAETLRKLSESNKGRKPTAEQCEKQSIRMKGTKLSASAVEKLRLANLGNKHTLGYKHTVESKAKISAAAKGCKRSDETKAKISAAAKRIWADRKLNKQKE